ncbi:hypothetical protein EJ08DRAFT_646304 [Tothia fuscella]|uniref:F-box domain-containing protein n=1 Tax=Tothia fuscella TaxID=1048955 RepID=A0A9P4U2T5_9PEZI|nr:hypothetical protein EJ08DRAFT_646304 [Tothia fuscella]
METKEDLNYQTSSLLRLPTELRRQIYSDCLPHTIPNNIRSESRTLWRRASINLLLVCRSVCADDLDILYGTNTFEIDICYDAIKFRYTWLIPSGLKPKVLYNFPSYFTSANVQRIRNCIIDLEHVDDYTGRIKYNMGGAGLTAGIRDRVAAFVNEVRDVGAFGKVIVRLSYGNRILSDIRRVKVLCREAGRDTEAAQTVLEPFKCLTGVRRAEVSGSVTPKYAAEITQAMIGKADGKTLPMVAAKEVAQDPAVLWRWKNSWNA